MNGIDRIHINSDWDEPRLNAIKLLEPSADILYAQIFNDLNFPILSGVNIINCTKEEAMARYDYQEGIDVILHFADGTKATLQEKYLTTKYSTATFTEHQKNKPGAWYTCTAQYYFVGYARETHNGDFSFQEWALLDLAMVHLASPSLNWRFGDNKENGYTGIKFRFIQFDEIPDNCITAIYSRYS